MKHRINAETMKKLFLSIGVMSLLLLAAAQDPYEQFYDAVHEGDTTAMKASVLKIRNMNEQTAERYIAEYNYYYNMSSTQSGLVTSVKLPSEADGVQGEVYTLTDSTGAVAGYMYYAQRWDFARVDSALDVISRGIAIFPDRLDMWYGKIHLLQQLCRWNVFADEIHALLNRTTQNKLQWQWPNNNTPMEEVITDGIFDYEKELFMSAANDENTDKMRQKILLLRGVAEDLYHHFPKYVQNINLLAATYQVLEDRNTALSWLLKAEKIAPHDGVVLSNIADTYYMLGDSKNERKYLKKVIKYGTPEEKERAKSFLKE